eukprot:CAMPEP_0185764060 /NCGR_PEP_ID=MMETSP1174-20130828/22971_1 /TAXON_ID=35687 /ORGANISM="Dictyocha speculum, Strain CCMP1381" /LENGTH=134 /DNA_ID=CAMNT_0028446419 /DNA_START=82 /DNA_END=486 /DNA_ORIENTATION=-
MGQGIEEVLLRQSTRAVGPDFREAEVRGGGACPKTVPDAQDRQVHRGLGVLLRVVAGGPVSALDSLAKVALGEILEGELEGGSPGVLVEDGRVDDGRVDELQGPEVGLDRVADKDDVRSDQPSAEKIALHVTKS